MGKSGISDEENGECGERMKTYQGICASGEGRGERKTASTRFERDTPEPGTHRIEITIKRVTDCLQNAVSRMCLCNKNTILQNTSCYCRIGKSLSQLTAVSDNDAATR